MEEIAYWITLSRVAGIGRARLRRLKEYFGTLDRVWCASAGQLRSTGLDEKTLGHLLEARSTLDPDAELVRLKQCGIQALAADDERYPARLREAPDGPAVLYVRGSLPRDEAPLVAVVGTRRPTSYGRQATAELVDGLVSRGVVIVSGLAIGIDTVAHRQTLEQGGTTVAVIASGLDLVYPAENLSLAQRITGQGALVSEYPPGVKPRPESFLLRNRIMSGLSLGVVVVEAGERSGALRTAHAAVDQDREVFALPGSIFSTQSRGTNRLIQEGAKLVRSVEDILVELGMEAATHESCPPLPAQADAVQVRVLAAMSSTPLHADDLARELVLPSGEVSAALTLLELQGLVQDMGNMQYVVSPRWRTVAS
jgi:DNA processing protein